MAVAVFLLVWILGAVGAATARAADWQFRRVADSGLPTHGPTYGGTWADIDGDGRRDLVLSRHADNLVEIYRGRGDLRFTGPEPFAIPAGLLDHHGTAACDHDGDGDWDLYLTVGADVGLGLACKQLWCNEGGLVFTGTIDCDQVLADPDGRGRGALWLRLDGTPLPQLLLLNYQSPPRLFGRDPGGAWEDQGGRLAVPPSAWWSVAVSEDFDGDGAVDLFAAGDTRVLRRNVGGQLVPVEAAALATAGPPVSAAAAGDCDGDGDPDLLLGLRGGSLVLMLNSSEPGTIRFGEVRVYPDLPLVKEPVSVVLADLDNDGRLDLAVAQLGARGRAGIPLLARGRGDGTFAAVDPAAAGLEAVPSRATGLWALDLDGDGDLDLVVTNGEGTSPRTSGAVLVYENLAGTPGVTLELAAAVGAAPHGLGARVTLGGGGGERSQAVRCVANPWNATTLPVHFGLGDRTGPAVLTVAWPAGGESRLETGPRGGALRASEPRR